MSHPTSPSTQTRSDSMPGAVGMARSLAFGLVGLLAIRTLLSIALSDNLVDAYVDEQDTSGQFVDEAYLEMLRDGAPAYTAIALISLLLFGGLLLLAAWKFPARAGWARIVAIVIGALTALGGLLVVFQPAPLWYILLGLLIAAVAIGMVVQLFTSVARDWFRRADG